MNKQTLRQFILLAIYDDVPTATETMFDIINNKTIMVDGGEINKTHEATYPNKYQSSIDFDKFWVQTFAKYVSRWFWKHYPLPVTHTFFIADVDITDDWYITISWGSR